MSCPVDFSSTIIVVCGVLTKSNLTFLFGFNIGKARSVLIDEGIYIVMTGILKIKERLEEIMQNRDLFINLKKSRKIKTC